MRYRVLALMLGFVVMLYGVAVKAAVTDVRATPGQVTLLATTGTVTQLRWQVATTADHASGVSSPAAAIIDPSTGEILERVDTSLEAAGGGPFVLRETLRIDASTIRQWFELGLQRVVLERSFADAATGASVVARVVLRLSGSRLQSIREGAPSELSVASLRLEFDTGNNTIIVTEDTPLQAALTVQHTGTGVLRGRWQIAEPGSSEIVPVFRTLALVNAQVRGGQRSYYRSPALPTGRAGVYALRFCVAGPDLAGVADDPQCPDAAQIAYGSYQVQEDTTRPARIGGLTPDRSRAGAETLFRWDTVPAAATYQFQVFEVALRAGSGDPAPPRFVGGVLVRGGAGETPLGPVLHNKLNTGQRYLWRVTAHDETGRIVGSSVEATFVYGLDDQRVAPSDR